jgi:hypothetical protein
LAESLIEQREHNPGDQLARYLAWYRTGHLSSTGECFDIGITTLRSVLHYEKTKAPYSGEESAKEAGKTAVESKETEGKEGKEGKKWGSGAGNGSLMRLAALPVFFVHNPVCAAGDRAALR